MYEVQHLTGLRCCTSELRPSFKAWKGKLEVRVVLYGPGLKSLGEPWMCAPTQV